MTIPRERSTLVDVKTAQDHRLTLKCARVLLSERSQFFCCWTARLWDDTGPPGRSQNVLCGGRPSNETVPWCSLGVVGCVTKDCRQKWVCLRHSPAFFCCTVALIIIFKLRIIYRDRGEIVWMQQLAILRRDQVAERAEGSTNVLQTVGTNQIRQTGRE